MTKFQGMGYNSGKFVLCEHNSASSCNRYVSLLGCPECTAMLSSGRVDAVLKRQLDAKIGQIEKRIAALAGRSAANGLWPKAVGAATTAVSTVTATAALVVSASAEAEAKAEANAGSGSEQPDVTCDSTADAAADAPAPALKEEGAAASSVPSAAPGVGERVQPSFSGNAVTAAAATPAKDASERAVPRVQVEYYQCPRCMVEIIGWDKHIAHFLKC
ncbi:hypothetical protein AYI70_g6249 [Smittium culicis]|uniref:Uncharacterized protein n=1 Tax=Smittium culicis TaxID=133412 RepID=A0A1R1XQZ5_9FUNG|nr:hypothetical protein AYI70_g6249 [Smittium culicis]